MGLAFSSIFGRLSNTRECKMLVLGLPRAGKTSVLDRLKLGHVVYSYPAPDLWVESIHAKDMWVYIMDVGRGDSRLMGKHKKGSE